MAKKEGGSSLFYAVSYNGGNNEGRGTSAPQNTAVGSGSRPTKSVHEIKSSAPADCYGLGRATKNALK